MKLVVVVLCVLLTFGAVIHGTEKFPNRIVSNTGNLVTWTADWPTDARVEFLGATKLNLEMRCDLSKVFSCKSMKTKRLEFCFYYKSPVFKRCTSLNSVHREKDVMLGSVTGKATFYPNGTGGKLVFSNVEQEKEFPVVAAYCTAREESGSSVMSNQLFILDFRKNFPKEVWERSEVVELRRNSPSTVKCRQTSLGIDKKLKASSERFRQPAVPVTFEWFLCSGAKSAAECDRTKTSLRDAASFFDWPVQVWPDGELYSPFVPAAAVPKLQDKQLICYLMNKPAAFYSSPLKIVNSTKSVSKLDMIRPPIDAVKVILYNSTDYSLTLPCLFKVPPVRIHISWRVRKGLDAFILEAGKTNKKFGVSVSAQSDAVTLRGPFYAGTIDYLTCGVIPEDGNIDERVGAYEVIIKGPPRPAPEIPKTKLVADGGNTSIRCLFEDSKRMIPSLWVNGFEIDLKSQENINRAKEQMNGALEGYLPPINFSVSPVNPEAGQVITYAESNVRYGKNSTHVVTCVAELPPFQNRARVVIKTVPIPKLRLDVPEVCIDNCELTAHLENAAAFKKECAGIAYFWAVSESCPYKGSPDHERKKWQFESFSTGNQTVCGCVHVLDVTDGTIVYSICSAKWMMLKISFFKDWRLWIIIVVIISVLAIIIGIAVYFFKRKGRRGAPDEIDQTMVPLKPTNA